MTKACLGGRKRSNKNMDAPVIDLEAHKLIVEQLQKENANIRASFEEWIKQSVPVDRQEIIHKKNIVIENLLALCMGEVPIDHPFTLINAREILKLK